MSVGRRSTVTETQRGELWRRYKAGETVLGIASALDQRPTNLYRVLQAAGRIAPAPRSRSPKVLSFGEREEISRGIAAGDTFRAIARSLNRAVSTVSQEVARHRRTPALTRRSSGLGSLGVGASTEALSARPQPAVAADCCG